ncbi:uncharacterized protein LOC107224533 isoform X1 [Neodiprion lecontei]|uniref:Uncharacterized protein LOC107224533 isoform X1 n=1 Tax=Neodiprion lecontei TaxID=441921 RepID=A0ABM3FDL8_NEOLC|nr:uncharacterized protein LOC107224533 isoform X1 [Neodiprion lecontei]XP_046586108.1 uncharacterized protein LOC107224533 isoform X1 [Neodiprion lecontei]XP_046586111.1 uncharacterized protein LOC107224533 isoform X1 [Neodiprion lecontei]XP_046586115.1 uncharacterized protein LOC107224533 isoform X1 [Neodiprion lecontei]XP_046586122.1 uncharacterized protein LOC107224533 isoform X1 [Neodiprion lecontei]
MAQYYNIVTNPSGTVTLEEIQRVCSVEGQNVQFVVEDFNNGLNGSPQLLTYTTAAPTSEQAVFGPQAINISGQLPTNHIDHRQNVYIIETNEVSQSHNVIKNTVSAQLIGENVVNVENRGSPKIPLNNTLQGQSMQWVQMQENNINFDTVLKQNTSTPVKTQVCGLVRNQTPTNTQPHVSLNLPTQRIQSEQPGLIPVTKKSPSRLYQNKNKQLVANATAAAAAASAAAAATTSNCPQHTGNIANPQEDRLLNTNLVNNRNINTTFRPKMFVANRSDATKTPGRQVRNVIRQDTPLPRNSVPLQMPKNQNSRKLAEEAYLTEREKVAKFKELQKSPMAVLPQFQRQILQQNLPQRQQQMGANVTHHQRQQMSATNQQRRQQISNNPAPNLQSPPNAGQQRQQQMTLTPLQQAQLQRQPMMMTPHQKQQHQLQPSPVQQQMEVDSQEFNSQEPAKTSQQQQQQSCGSQTESDSASSPSLTFVQKPIDNPQTCIVQRQINGNTAKMLVVLPNGEQRLITFDIPNEECTVHDLLEQVTYTANIPFGPDTNVSLVTDQTFQINFVVEAGPGTFLGSGEGSEQSDSNLSLDKLGTSPGGSSPVFSPSEENSNSSLTQHEEPKYVDGKLAVCQHCGISSIDFNRCQRCKTKLPDDVKNIPMTIALEVKKENMLAIDVRTFYKKSNEQNRPLKIDRDGSVPSKRGRGRGRPAPKARLIKEPECLTISSDEDDQGEGKIKKSLGSSHPMSAIPGHTRNQIEIEMISEKEPVITNNSVSSMIGYDIGQEEGIKGGGREYDAHNMADGSIQAPQTSLICRTVRIGSYKYIPQERVIISQSGVRLGVPLLEDNTNFVPLEVKLKDIVKVLIHFGKAMPVLFFYTTTSAGGMIRELLGMQDPKGPYYDPAGKDHTLKRITLLPEKISDEAKIILKTLFPSNQLLEELSSKEANDILVKASPKDSWQVQSMMKKSGQTTSAAQNTTNGGIQTIMVYPPPPAKGGIAINTEDYACLGEDQFLNDVIIDFYLRYLTLEVLSEEDQNRTHVFSSYFYKRLTSPHAPAADTGVPLSPAAKRHARVQKWTKNVNIFEKDFIVIPINEHAHWFLAIICFPGFVGKVPIISSVSKECENKKKTQKSKKAKELKLQAVTIGNTTITPVTATITLDPGDEGSERDEAEGDDDEMEMESDDEDETEDGETETKPPQKPREPTPVQNEIVKLPCILIFDSLAGASRSRVVATLRDYLSCEYLAKMGTEQVFSKDTIKGASPKVPQQSNFTDCGVYVLQYVESFFSNPIKNYTLPIKTLKQWFEEIIVTRKREELSKLLVRLMNATKGERNIMLPVLTFPTAEGRLLPKSENNLDIKTLKSEADSKKKTTSEIENRNNSSTSIGPEENTEKMGEALNRNTNQILAHSPPSSLSSNENSQTDMTTDGKAPTKSSALTYMKLKRIIKSTRIPESQDDKQTTKKHKGDSFETCK